MKRFLLSAFILGLATSASAHWAVLPSDVSVAVGETTKVLPFWDHGISWYEDRDDFASDNPSVAEASGFVAKTGGSGGITVRGIAPGVAHIINTTIGGEVVATISVHAPAMLDAIGSPAGLVVVQLNTSIDLHAIANGWTASTCTWYRGRVGDRSMPMLPSGLSGAFDFWFYAHDPGITDLWAELGGVDGIAAVQFEILVPSKRRTATH